MRHRKLATGLLVAAVPLTISAVAFAKRMIVDFDDAVPTFELQGRPLGGARPATPTPAHLTGARIMAAGDGALVIDADSGALLKTDGAGAKVAELAIGRDAGLLTYDAAAGLAYVADRLGDKIVVVKVGTRLEVARSIKTPAEPYGVALTPDKKTLLVATIADRTLVALDAATGAERWRTPLGREPRGLAVSPDGTRALVAYLVTGTVDQIDLLETHRAEHVAISTTTPAARRGRQRGREGDSFARGSFAVTFLGEHQAIVPFQRETPVQQLGSSERSGSYGGGFESPVSHHLAFLGLGKGHTNQVSAKIAEHQPRALAWDPARDALYVAGLGSDTVMQLKHASQVGIALGTHVSVAQPERGACGPDGLAIAPDGDLLVWCAFTRSVQRVDVVDKAGTLTTEAKVSHGPTLVASAWTTKQHEGLVLFHASEAKIAARGAMACATCHPDNRADGLSWRIEKHELQTPVLAGRMAGTHPYKWDGGDATLELSLTNTMKRLGGFGLDKKQVASLAAYVEALPTVRTPTRDPKAVARGKQLFDGQAGCRTCHDGPKLTDNERHKLTGTLAESDTPSLLGLAASAPYFHDGSAATLEALLRERGAVHGMADTKRMSDQQIRDLTAFLETL